MKVVADEPKIQEPVQGTSGIRCPRCHWTPREEDTWGCSCGNFWNTFDTGGICPACMKQWTSTQCPRCGEWSAHSDWYPVE